ncbi:hypothetical protein BDF20DRAFT_821991, partial [Mycotypha africana]
IEEIVSTVKLQRNVKNKYSTKQKLLFVYMNRLKLFNVAKADSVVSGIVE